MKKSLLALGLLLSFLSSFAAQQTATLQSGNTFTPFYGDNALMEAYAQAVDGDIITLSPGSFSAPSIDKSITIIGAYGFDTEETKSSILRGVFSVSSDNVKLEGVYIYATMEIKGADNLSISRSYIYKISELEKEGHKYHDNTVLTDCAVDRYYAMTLSKNTVIRNCCINGFHNRNESTNLALIENCNLPRFTTDYTTPTTYYQPYAIYRNCLLGFYTYSAGSRSITFTAPYEFSNCLFLESKNFNSSNYQYYTITFNCVNENGEKYQLSTSTGNTGVPGYGTLEPYTYNKISYGPIEPKYYPSIPQITSSEIDTQTDKEGKLHVKISATARD